ncbi:hypothetical protein PSAB6_50083 [Paraburkholderia sabiae]|nr:hypothetical protein PSAB6_50083 [Paraburkholderia sabiae]
MLDRADTQFGSLKFFAASAYYQGTLRVRRRPLWEHFPMRDRSRKLLRQIRARNTSSTPPRSLRFAIG